MKNKLVVGFFIFTVLLSCVKASIFSWSPRYHVQAEFSINWNHMSDDKNYRPEQARAGFDKALMTFKPSNQLISEVCQDCNIPSTESKSLAKDLHKYLRITRIGKTDNSDLYLVQFADNNQAVALKTANLLSSRMVARVNSRAKIQHISETLHPLKDYIDIRNQDDELRNQLASLEGQQNDEYDADRQDQINDTQDQLDLNDWKKMLTGFQVLAGGVQIFTNPAKIQQLSVIVTG